MGKSFEEIFSEIERLLGGYALEFRASLEPYRYQVKLEVAPDYVFDPLDRTVRDSVEDISTESGVLEFPSTYLALHNFDVLRCACKISRVPTF